MVILEHILTAELVIPSYNRIATLQTTLNQIRMIYPDLRICLGLQGEMPHEFLEQMDRDPNVRVLRLTAPGTTPTLNSCIFSSQADIVLVSDDDSVPHFGWLESHMKAFSQDPDLAYTAGREVRSTKEKSSFSSLIRILVEAIFGMFLSRNKKLNGRIVGWTNSIGLIFGNLDQPGTCVINTPRGCNMALRRSFFTEIGGFNERFRGNAYLFEADFGIRMAKKNKLGQYRGDAIVIHHEVPSGGSRAARSQWFEDYLFNHRFIIDLLGPQAWLGSLPRLVKRRLFN
jgi:cellulose synthase/poly-beta-1,6-N-acetylglucosamine synthase-like glycosyltransferase